MEALRRGDLPVRQRGLELAHRNCHSRAPHHLGGVFDRIPNLQLIVGHMGEALPFMLSRVDVMTPDFTRLRHSVSHYLRNHVHYTFAGFNFTPTFLDLLLQVGVGRIMFSADYPYGSMTEARAFLEKLPVSPADKEQIAHGNAERLLGL